MNEMQAVLAKMTEITELARNAPQRPTLDWNTLVKEFGPQLDAYVEAQVKARMDALPAFRTPGAGIPAEGELPRGNRYNRFLKGFHRDGQYREAGTVFNPVDLLIAHTMLDAQVKHYSPAMGGPAAQPPSDDLQNAIKALTSTGAGTGDELVPTNLAGELWNDIFLASRIAANMTRIDMPTNPFDVPLGLGAVTWRKGTENTATTASDPATAKSTLTATELITEQNWSYTLEEDAVIAMAPAIRQRLAQSGAEIIDDFALNADATNAATGNINLVDADPDNGSYFLSDGQDGLRHQWLVDNTAMTFNAGGDALAETDLRSALALMGKYAVNPERLLLITDVNTYLKGLLGLTNVTTVDKFGPNAVILTGQLAAVYGIPIIVSASSSLANADGKVSTTPANNTLGSITLMNRSMWDSGFRRQLLIETDRDVQKRQYIMVTSLRMAVAAHGTRSSAAHTAGIRNILVS